MEFWVCEFWGWIHAENFRLVLAKDFEIVEVI